MITPKNRLLHQYVNDAATSNKNYNKYLNFCGRTRLYLLRNNLINLVSDRTCLDLFRCHSLFKHEDI